MKNWKTITAGLLAVTAVAAIAVFQLSGTRPGPPELGPAIAAPGSLLGVEELVKNVDSYEGPIRVEGVVSGVDAEQQRLALIDIREFEACGLSECAEVYLPVQWEGSTMPAVSEAIQLYGEVRGLDGKLIFVAQSMEKAPPRTGDTP